MTAVFQTYAELRLDLAAQLAERMDPLEAAQESWRWFTEGLGLSRAWLMQHGQDPAPEALRHRLSDWLRSGSLEPWIQG